MCHLLKVIPEGPPAGKTSTMCLGRDAPPTRAPHSAHYSLPPCQARCPDPWAAWVGAPGQGSMGSPAPDSAGFLPGVSPPGANHGRTQVGGTTQPKRACQKPRAGRHPAPCERHPRSPSSPELQAAAEGPRAVVWVSQTAGRSCGPQAHMDQGRGPPTCQLHRDGTTPTRESTKA